MATLVERIAETFNQIALDISALTNRLTATKTLIGEYGKTRVSVYAHQIEPSTVDGCSALQTVSTTPTTDAPDSTSLNFNQTTEQYTQFAVTLPSNWDKGSITAKFKWSHTTTTVDYGVVWGIQAVALSDDQLINTSYGTASEVTDTGGTSDTLYITDETASFTVAGTPVSDNVIYFRIYRKATDTLDTLDIVARLHAVDLFITRG